MEKLGKLSELKEVNCIRVGGKSLAVFKVKDKVYCTAKRCTHFWALLCKGNLDGYTLTCPWHGSQFDVRTGEVKKGPAKKPLETYTTKIKNGEVFVEV